MDSQLLIRGATNSKYKDKKDEKKFLASITHLSLDNKNIETIENLEICVNLSVLYLSENRISQIRGMENLKNLIQLNLDDNKIMKIEGLDSLVNLRRLNLGKNCISRLEGLTNCRSLEELYLSKQTLPSEIEFTFDEYSLAAISMGLKVLHLDSCNVYECVQLYYLESVVELNLRDNYIQDIDQVAHFLRTINFLRSLDLRSNPVQKTVKYRDQIVMLGLKLQTLDDKNIMEQERRYLYNLVQQKEIKAARDIQIKMRKQYSASKLEENKDTSNITAPNFTQKRQNSLSKPGNLSQQNANPFGVTNRGYKGQMIKANGQKPPIGGGMMIQGKPNKVMQQAGLSVLGNQMAIGADKYEDQNQQHQMHPQYKHGEVSSKSSGKRQYSVNINQGSDFTAADTAFQNTKQILMHRQ